jgi:immunoglobulin-binding protein 1
MTLEEFAELEMERAHEREQKEKAAALETPTNMRYNQLVAEGLEDDLDLVDESAKHDRDWDDWKDHNPRGSGNKMGKRF